MSVKLQKKCQSEIEIKVEVKIKVEVEVEVKVKVKVEVEIKVEIKIKAERSPESLRFGIMIKIIPLAGTGLDLCTDIGYLLNG